MLKIANREKFGWFNEKSCKNFPREELKIIDNLWVKYSDGKFGFSVQKKIWIECGGTPGRYDEDAWEKFCEIIGWDEGETFNINAPVAHLPAPGWLWVWRLRSLSSLFYRI